MFHVYFYIQSFTCSCMDVENLNRLHKSGDRCFLYPSEQNKVDFITPNGVVQVKLIVHRYKPLYFTSYTVFKHPFIFFVLNGCLNITCHTSRTFRYFFFISATIRWAVNRVKDFKKESECNPTEI